MIFTIYADESGTHGSGTTMVAGYVGHAGQWKKFEKKWEKILDDAGLEFFHANEFKQTWNDANKRKTVAQIAKVEKSKTLFGFVADLNDDDFARYYAGPDRPKGFHFDSKYGLCVRMALNVIPFLLREIYPKKKIEISLVLELGAPNGSDAVRVFSDLKKNAEIGPMLSEISYADKKDCYGCQLADALAWSAFGWKRDDAMELEHYSSEERAALIKEMAAKIKQSHQNIRLIISKRVLEETRNNIFLTKENKRKHWEKGGAKPSSSAGKK